MRCRNVLTRVDALRTGELSAEESHLLHEHMSECPSCGDSLEDVGTLASSLKTLLPRPPRSCRESLQDTYEEIHDGAEAVWVVFSGEGLRLVRRGGTLDELRSAYAERHCRTLRAGTMPSSLRRQVDSALSGKGSEKPAVDWDAVGTGFQRDVLRLLTRIPRGQVRTYEWLARQAGRPRAVRAVGNILAHNAVPIVVPCHRVVPSSGGIGNYAFGSESKRELLRREGVDVDALDRLGRKGVRYIGSRTTRIVCFPTCGDARRIREENRVPFRAAAGALKEGFRPCRKCQPFVA